MAKRFTDTEIWEQDWFLDLPNKYKLVWNYVKDKCDNVGIWRPNKSLLQKIIGEPINLKEFFEFINLDKERLKILPNERWWIKDFFIFQYGDKFSPESKVHKAALKTLVQNGLHIKEIFKEDIGNLKDIDFQQLKEIAYAKDINILSIAYGKHTERVKEKEKEKEKKIYKILKEKNTLSDLESPIVRLIGENLKKNENKQFDNHQTQGQSIWNRKLSEVLRENNAGGEQNS